MEHGFGVADMPECVDLMDNACAKIARNGKKIMDDDFMFGIFDPIKKKVLPFADYLEYMFDHKTSSSIGSFKTNNKVTPWDLLRCDLMFPTRKDIIQSQEMTGDTGVHFAVVMRHEFRNTSKATAKYLGDIKGAKSIKKVSRAERNTGLNVFASNIVSESLHGASTNVLVAFGTIIIPNVAGIGQLRTNNDHGRSHKNIVSGRKAKTASESRNGAYVDDAATLLDLQLCRSLTATSRDRADQHKKEMKGWTQFQFGTRQRKEQVKMDEALMTNRDQDIVSLYFLSSQICRVCGNPQKRRERNEAE